MEKLFQQIREFYEGLEPERQKMLLVAVVCSLAMVIAVGFWANAESWRPVVTGTNDEVSRGAAALARAGITSRVDGNGSELTVRDADMGQAQLAVAEANVVPNCELGIDVPAHLTPRQQEYFLLRMEETCLANMIAQFEAVEYSWVNLNPGDEVSYIGREKKASASIMLRVRPGVSLSERQVQAIVGLVAMSVDGLDPGRVSVSDQDGSVLKAPETEGFAGTGEALAQLQILQQTNIERSVTEALKPLLGALSAVSVKAVVSLDHREEQRMDESIDTDQAITTKEQTRDRLTTDGDARGAAGTASNGADSMVGDGQGSTTEESQSSTETRAPTSVTLIKVRPGDIERISVTVLVDERVIDSIAASRLGEDADEAAVAEARLRVQEQIRTASNAAAGYDTSRGDVVEVVFLPFQELPVIAEAPATVGMITLPWLPYAVAALGLLLGFWFVVRPLIKAVTVPPQMAPGTMIGPNGEVITAATDEEEDEGEEDLAARLRLLVENYESVDAADLNRLVDREAEAAAQVLRQWSAKG